MTQRSRLVSAIPPRTAPDGGVGAWGIRLGPVPESPQLLSAAPPEWPWLDVCAEVHDHPSRVSEWGPDRAQYSLLGGHHIRVQRDPLRAELQLSRPTPAEGIVVPHLSSAASTVALWNGAQPFHAGGFVHQGGAWGVLGDKGAGKTSMLAVLNELGMPIVTDDLLIYDRGDVLAGPRCLDLRRGAARRLRRGRDIGVVGTRRRWRVYLPPCPSRVPLHGWIVPKWGDPARVELIEPGQRIALLPAFRALRVPWQDPVALLDLASQPIYRWTRPRSLADMPGDVRRLLDQLALPG